MTPDRARLIARIHASPGLAVLAVTGGGSQAVADLLTVPGASRTVLEAVVPYSTEALGTFLGDIPRQAVSPETAAALAHAAYRRAMALHPARQERRTAKLLIGVSCTAALRSDRPKKGSHRLHVGVRDAAGARVSSLVLVKDVRDRLAEERLAADLLLNALARACNVSPELELMLHDGERIDESAPV